MNWRKVYRSLRLVTVLGVIGGALLVHFYLPKLIIETKPLHQPERMTNDRSAVIAGYQNLKLSCNWYFASREAMTIIFLHGIRANKEHFTPLATQLVNRGYNVLTVDHRAHGASEGEYCTFGYNEKKDVKMLVDWLEEKTDGEIGVWGQSLGGAIGLQAMGYDDRLAFGIIESTFSDFTTIVGDYFERVVGFQFDWLTSYLANRAAEMAEFDAKGTCPEVACKSITQPILMVHGSNDKRIDVKYGRANFDQLKATDKTFCELPQGNHLNIWEAGGDVYFDQVFALLDRVSEVNN